MAELAINAAHVLVDLLSPFLEKLDLKKDVLNDIQSMRSWLGLIKAFIEDNNGHGGSRQLQDKVEQVRDIAYEIEDVLEEFVRHSPHVFRNHKITQKAHKIAHNIKHGFPLGDISEKIAAIKEKIDGIRFQNEVFPNGGLNNGSGTSSGFHRVSPLLLDEEMDGYEEEKRRFSSQLTSGEKGFLGLAVEGPGGSGKTTFVKNVFWKPRVRGKFDCHAWVHVSRKCDIEKILSNMLNQFSGSVYPADDILATAGRLRNYLTGKRYVVVLDDIWRVEDWNWIMSALPNGSRGSRIIVTTRDSNVASICSSSRNTIYTLNGLRGLEGWSLFCKKAFPDSNGECPSELKDCGSRIVARCEGLPFAIVAVGSALSQKPKLPNEWERFHNNLGCDIGTDSRLLVIGNTLLPGYMDLSTNLKSCFLYFSIFPEDYSVECGRLIRLWVAEQFAVGRGSKTAEEVAEDYLNELIHRNLVHVSKRDFDGRPRSCRVLNLVLQFITQKCKDENFASIFQKIDRSVEIVSGNRKIRRLSLHYDCTRLSQRSDFAGVRSMFLFRCDNISSSDLEKNFPGIKLLRILDLQGAHLTEFPRLISNQILLTYLCLRGTNVKVIPKSIKRLLFLQTLDLKQTDVTELPKQISRLHQLRHLFAYKYTVTPYVNFDSVRGVKILGVIGDLTNLQELCHVKVGQKGELIKDLRKLGQLKKVGLLGLKRDHCKDVCESISHLEKLNTLDLTSSTKEEFLDLEELKTPPLSLQRLYLKGRMGRLPGWINFSLANVMRISLKWSKMTDSPLKALGSLPNLMELQLVDCFVGGELVFEASSFKKLKILLIEDFPLLHTLKIEEGSMPELQQMSLHKCPNLKMLPLGIDRVGKIEELVLRDMPTEFRALFGKSSEDRWMVRHIPVIHSYTQSNKSWLFENLSDTSFDHASTFF